MQAVGHDTSTKVRPFSSDFALDPYTPHAHPPWFDRSPRALTRINRITSASNRPQLLKLQILRSATCEVCYVSKIRPLSILWRTREWGQSACEAASKDPMPGARALMFEWAGMC